MNIFFFKFPLKDTLGGAEFHTLQLAKHFAAEGQKVKLFTSDQKLFRLFEKNGLSRKRLSIGFEPTSQAALLLWPLTYLVAQWKFKKLLDTIPPGSVFFMQSLIEKLMLTPLALSTGFKICWLEHKIPGRWLKLNPLKFRYLNLAKQIQIVTVSNFAKQEFVELRIPENKIRVIYPGVNPHPSPLPRQGEREREGSPADFKIGLLSRLESEKGVYDFLKIVAPHLPTRPNWQILIAGHGKEKNQIEQLINNRDLQNQIHLLGLVKDLDSFFSLISILVYPTKVPESFGISILEAQVRGIPVIATEIGALPEIIKQGENGFLIKPKKPERWLEYLEKLQGQKLYQSLSKNALISAQKFSEEKMFAEFEKLIESIK